MLYHFPEISSKYEENKKNKLSSIQHILNNDNSNPEKMVFNLIIFYYYYYFFFKSKNESDSDDINVEL